MTKREKIGVARPKGRPYGGSATRLADGGRGGAVSGQRPESSSFGSTGRTDAWSIGASDGCRKNDAMESDVSDDDSNSPSIDELLDLVHEHQKVIKKQLKKLKTLVLSKI